jgi:hypothetical protein
MSGKRKESESIMRMAGVSMCEGVNSSSTA